MKHEIWFTSYNCVLVILILLFILFFIHFFQNKIVDFPFFFLQTESFYTKDTEGTKGTNVKDVSDFTIQEGNSIPKIIIQTWKTKDIPPNYVSDVESIRRLNPTYEYHFFTDDDIEIFLEKNYPEYYQTYKLLPVKIQKFDFFRYVAVYHYGGFYFDLDITGLEPLDELLSLECVFPIDDFISEDMCHLKRYKDYCNKNMDYLLGQYAFAAKPGHAFIKLLIDTIHKNINKYIQRYHSKDFLNHEVYVYETTGPDFVTNVYMDYMNKPSITIIEYHKRQYFGKYAQHNYKGTWKKDKSN